MEAIKFEKVHFSYRSEEEESENDVFGFDSAFALSGIDFSVREGEFVAVLGHNGSGKSTLARLTNGLLRPASGNISVLGMDASDEKNLFEIRKNVGIVFQNPDNQTVASIVEDDVAFGPENIGVPREEIGRRIEFALNAVGMSEYRHSTTTRLSGGQKQRIAIAGVLALKPRVMILDESTAMLDPRGRKEVMDVVLKLNKEENITVLLITHFPEEALLADRAIVMNKGKIVMEGKPEDVLTREDELQECGLTLPCQIAICKQLNRLGIAVSPTFDTEKLADEIATALQNKGAGTRSTAFDKQDPMARGRFTSIPSVARSESISSSVMLGSLVFSSMDLYSRPLVLKNLRRGRPLSLYHSVSSSRLGFSSLMSRNSYSMLFSSSHLRAFWQVVHLG